MSDDLGNTLREARERAHLTQEQVAERVGVSLRTVGNWERGQSIPRNRLAALESVLKIDGLDDRDVSPPEESVRQAILTYLPESERTNLTELDAEELISAARDAVLRRYREIRRD